MKLYKAHGSKRVIGHPDLPLHIRITKPQLDEAREAREHLHVVISGNVGQRTNGWNLKWLDMLKRFDKHGNLDIYEGKLIDTINQVYHQDYPGRLTTYLDDIDNTYAGLESVGNYYTERQKIQQILRNIMFSENDRYLATCCREYYSTFSECYEYLRKETSQRESENSKISTRKAHSIFKETPHSDLMHDPSEPSFSASHGDI